MFAPRAMLPSLVIVRYRVTMAAVFLRRAAERRRATSTHLAGGAVPPFRGLVDPHLLGQRRWLGHPTHDAAGIVLKGMPEHPHPVVPLLLRVPSVNRTGREGPQAAMMVFVSVPVKNSRQNPRVSCRYPKRAGNPGRYFMVLNWLSEYGLSLETWGRLWVLITPRSANKKATGLDLIDEPWSA